MKPKDVSPPDGSYEIPPDDTCTDEQQAIDDIAAEFGAQPAPSDLETELAEARGRALRAQAELENFRKRSRREMDDAIRYATIPLVRELLPVIDNLDRALAVAENDETSSGLQEGVRMVAAHLQSVLAQNNCTVIDAQGQPFDPMFHEALQELPSEDVPRGHVSMVHQSGYRLHDRVIRPAQVIVSKGPAE